MPSSLAVSGKTGHSKQVVIPSISNNLAVQREKAGKRERGERERERERGERERERGREREGEYCVSGIGYVCSRWSYPPSTTT